MRKIFSELLNEMDEGRDTMLVTVVGDRGSAPRGAGAAMLVGEKGRIVGTVGGGAVEYASEGIAKTLLAEKKSGVHDFALRPNKKEDLGMHCGGDVTLLFEYVPADDLRWSFLAGAVCDRIEAKREGWLIRPLDGGVPSLYGKEGLLCGDALPEETASALCVRSAVLTKEYASEPLPQYGRVVIFGGGHIAQSLVPLLGAVDFRCVVLDSRADYAKPELFPGAEEVICCDYERISDFVTLTGEDYAVVMTNGHEFDLTVEEQVLRLPHAYLGVVGSRGKIAFVNKTLTERGIDPALLETVHTPIGLSIRAVTPAEIAVSILAELILCRAEARDAEASGSHGCPMHRGG